MTDAESAVVRDAMPVPSWPESRGGQPEGYCHRRLVDAMRYLVAGGITWRAMPADFPAWDRVYTLFRRRRDKGLVAEFHDRLRDRVREAAGRDPEPTAGVIDAQSVKAAASVPAASRGFDGGKKVNGRYLELARWGRPGPGPMRCGPCPRRPRSERLFRRRRMSHSVRRPSCRSAG
ncbi:transposase [Streptomyces sp. NPDC017949]|uniref:transposase n=1 Tax=Streptomyces sp. NPDC017949 TaxID=3365020 RepID=UPI0037BAEBF6